MELDCHICSESVPAEEGSLWCAECGKALRALTGSYGRPHGVIVSGEPVVIEPMRDALGIEDRYRAGFWVMSAVVLVLLGVLWSVAG